MTRIFRSDAAGRLPRLAILFAAALLLGAGGLAALACRHAAPRAAGSTVIPSPATATAMSHRLLNYRLPNGMQVVLEPNHAAPVVAIQAWVRAGSADETAAENGLAHVHEHLLFKGTARRPPGAVAREIEAAGGEINAFTSHDATVYHLVLAADFFETGLEVLADVLFNAAFEQQELQRELEVIAGEEIKRAEDIPEHRLGRELFDLAYAAHPYRRPVIGTEKLVRGFAREQVLSFYQRFYRPENMVLVVTGDVDEQQAAAAIARHFAAASRPAPASRAAAPAEPEQQTVRTRVTGMATAEVHLGAAWHIPELQDEDVPALDLLAVILGGGESSRLYYGLKLRRPLVTSVQAYAFTPREPGLFLIELSCAPENAGAAMAEVARELHRLSSEAVGLAELEKVRAMIQAEAIYRRETVQGEAQKLGYFAALAGDPNYDEIYYGALAKVTPASLRRVAEEYLVLQKTSLAAIVPREQLPQWPDSRLLELLKPPPADAAAAAAPADGGVLEAQLPNGLRVILKEEHAVPLVAMRAAALGGVRAETDETNGLHHLLARLLTRGSARRSGDELARELDAMAATLEGFSGRNSTGLHGEFLARDFERALPIFLDVLFRPSFPEEEIAKTKVTLLAELQAKEDDLSTVAFDLFSRTLYRRHPYRLDLMGTAASLRRLTRDDLVAQQARIFQPGRVVLALAGDFNARLALARIEELTPPAAGRTVAPDVQPAEPPPAAPQVQIQETGKQQAHVVLGYLGATLTAADRFALEVLNDVLGGHGGRLFTELRDRKALAYAVSSYDLEGIEPGFIAVYLGTSPEKVSAAVAAVLEQLQRLVAEGVSAGELAQAKRHLIGIYAIGRQRNSARAALLAFNVLYGLPVEAVDDYPRRIAAVTAAEVHQAAQKYFGLERYALAVVAPPGTGLPDRPPETPADPQPPAGP